MGAGAGGECGQASGPALAVTSRGRDPCLSGSGGPPEGGPAPVAAAKGPEPGFARSRRGRAWAGLSSGGLLGWMVGAPGKQQPAANLQVLRGL